uniref:beta-N-acetylhexosaminidase n=1 Tax=Cyprinus carpio TaxID=7962 RepID=A0A8C2DGU7_CYPCA
TPSRIRTCIFYPFVHLDLKGAPPRIGYLIEGQLLLLLYNFLQCTPQPPYRLVQEMLQQIMKLHPKSTSLHIGADEVYMLGLRDESKQWLSVPGQSVHQLFCSHVIKVAKSVQESSPNLKLIMWDDMLRSMTPETFKGEHLTYLSPVLENDHGFVTHLQNVLWPVCPRLSSRTSCSFAGAKLAELIAKLTSLLESTELRRFQNNMFVRGWFTPFHKQKKRQTLDAVESQVQEVREEMCLLYSDSTVQEWVKHVTPVLEPLHNLLRDTETVLNEMGLCTEPIYKSWSISFTGKLSLVPFKLDCSCSAK